MPSAKLAYVMAEASAAVKNFEYRPDGVGSIWIAPQWQNGHGMLPPLTSPALGQRRPALPIRPICQYLVCCILVWQVSPAAAQMVSVADPYKGDYSPIAKQLVLNEGKLTVVLKMDRSQYFSNEAATLTIRFANSTSSVLEIRDPSDDRGPALDMMSKDPKWISMYGSEWGFLGSSPRALFPPKHPDPPSVLLAAGEFREQPFRTHESAKEAPIESCRVAFRTSPETIVLSILTHSTAARQWISRSFSRESSQRPL